MTVTTSEQVSALYRAILGRPPESQSVIDQNTGLDPVALALGLAASQEGLARVGRRPDSVLWFSNSQIPVEAIVRAHEDGDRKPEPGRLVNYLGVKIDPAFLPAVLSGREGQVEDVPVPANWHADMAEWAAALRAVDLARDTFRVLELGCGWGCWLLNTGVAARNRGLAVELIGAEGDEGHVAFAERGCAENGFTSDQVRIYRGIVGPREGTALFPRQDVSGISWGLQPLFDATVEQVAEAKAGGKYDVLQILTLDKLSEGKPIDLVHIDVQGGEVAFVEGCLSELARLVSYIVVGTHSREIEGRLMELLLGAGWILEIERPAIIGFDAGGAPFITIDGVQGWRNPKLRSI